MMESGPITQQTKNVLTVETQPASLRQLMKCKRTAKENNAVESGRPAAGISMDKSDGILTYLFSLCSVLIFGIYGKTSLHHELIRHQQQPDEEVSKSVLCMLYDAAVPFFVTVTAKFDIGH